MSAKTNLQNLVVAQGTTVKNIRQSISGVGTDGVTEVASKLDTTANDLVGAINEVKADVGAVDLTDLIDDVNQSTDTVYSSQQTKSLITQDIAAALEGEDLSDLAAQVAANAAADQSLLSFGAAQTLSVAQKNQVFTNLNLGADFDTHDFVADWNAAIA